MLKCHLEGKTCRKLVNRQNVYESAEEIASRGYSDNVLGLYTCTCNHYSQTSVLVHVYISEFTELSIYKTAGLLVLDVTEMSRFKLHRL